jgi:hypothetical protein
MILMGENQSTWRNTCPHATSSTTTHKYTAMASNLGVYGEKRVTHCLGHTTAMVCEFLKICAIVCKELELLIYCNMLVCTVFQNL